MRIIAHRGNINGPDNYENTREKLLRALDYGFDVEVDVQVYDNILYLGHCVPQEPIEPGLLKSDRIWVHCKTLRTFHALRYHGLNIFYHDKDLMTITQDGYLWHHQDTTHLDIESYATSLSVVCSLDYSDEKAERFKNLFGICTDYPEKYRKYYQSHQKGE